MMKRMVVGAALLAAAPFAAQAQTPLQPGGFYIAAEGVYRENTGTLAVGGFNAGFNFNEVAIMGNAYYDFLAGSAIVPYIGAGAGVAFLNAGALGATAQ